MILERFVRAINKEQPADQLQPLSDFQNHPAWILLGEPGAGKTTAFKHEAEKIGTYITVREFLLPEFTSVPNKHPVFLDGLDETLEPEALLKIKLKLKKFDSPPFRINCRAADWHSIDREDIQSLAAGELKILQLEPFDDEQIERFIQGLPEITDASIFTAKAKNSGIYAALRNPQFLQLFATTIKLDSWPNTRTEVYQLACEKLAQEHNERMRKKQNDLNQRSASVDIIETAGHLCALLLFSDQSGFALTNAINDVSKTFLDLNEVVGIDQKTAQAAIHSKLFIPDGEQQLIPAHRTIAEYLAANWVSKKLDTEGLSLKRILNLLVGREGKAIAALRGFYAWLACLSRKAKNILIERDSYSVLIYGDVESLDPSSKKKIFENILSKNQYELSQFFDAESQARFAALASLPAEVFLLRLQDRATDDRTQRCQRFILEILQHAHANASLNQQFLALIKDETRWQGIRKLALEAWLKTDTTSEQLKLLSQITSGEVKDKDDELAGKLLLHLYPKHLATQNLLQHLHPVKKQNLIGSYWYFWNQKLIEKIPEDDLPLFLDKLVQRAEPEPYHLIRLNLNEAWQEILAKGISRFGDNVSDDQLFNWLGVGLSEHITVHENPEIQAWLSQRPQRYLAIFEKILAHCNSSASFNYCVHMQKNRLYQAQTPANIVNWHLQQAHLLPTEQEQTISFHLRSAIHHLSKDDSISIQTIEVLDAWQQQNFAKQSLLESLLVEPIDYAIQNAKLTLESKQKENDWLQKNTQFVHQNLSVNAKGLAAPSTLDFLAQLYTPGQTESTLKKMSAHLFNPQDILPVVEKAFKNCLLRLDLPSSRKIIQLLIQGKRSFFSSPCLIGAQLLWQENPGNIKKLNADTIKILIGFLLTNPLNRNPEWFLYCLHEHADWVADVFIAHTKAQLKANFGYKNNLLHELANNTAFEKVARLATPPLLSGFPTLAQTAHLPYLKYLLLAALKYERSTILKIVEKKVKAKVNDAAKKVYWYLAAALTQPDYYEAKLWEFIDSSPQRAEHLLKFLDNNQFGLIEDDLQLSITSWVKLIQILAPHAELEFIDGNNDDWTNGEAFKKGQQIKLWLRFLSKQANDQAEQSLLQLKQQPNLHKLHHHLEQSLHELQHYRREKEFSFHAPNQVAQILANKDPTNPKDFASVVIDHLDDVLKAIRSENIDAVNLFWKAHDENSCRDILLSYLRSHLPFGIDCQPEGDYVNNKRADLRVSFQNKFEIPIEIKKQDNRGLYQNLREQLINQYCIKEGKTRGYGVYLVLWFGGNNMPASIDGGKKPTSPDELRGRLEASLTLNERKRIFIRVLDLSRISS